MNDSHGCTCIPISFEYLVISQTNARLHVSFTDKTITMHYNKVKNVIQNGGKVDSYLVRMLPKKVAAYVDNRQ